MIGTVVAAAVGVTATGDCTDVVVMIRLCRTSYSYSSIALCSIAVNVGSKNRRYAVAFRCNDGAI